MKRAILRSLTIAAITASISGIMEVVYYCFLCDPRIYAQHAKLGEPVVIVKKGYVRAAPGDSEFVCRTIHCLGPTAFPITCHDDLLCICTPGAPDGNEVMERMRRDRGMPIECTLDSRHPSKDNVSGPCRRGLCTAFFPE